MELESSTAPMIPLWLAGEAPAGPAPSFRPWLEPYLLETERPLGAVLICPGGGYRNRAPHEGEPVAQRFNRLGWHAFVVHYRVAPHRHPRPLQDAARALRLIRQQATTWQVDPGHVAICGFSAGGHLAASLGVHFRHPALQGTGPLERLSCRPDGLILCYPVITAGEFRHAGSFENLLGPDATPAQRLELSLETRVSPETPPTFLWHTADDPAVPVENSLLFAQALRRHRVPFELHVYPHGRHGLGLADEDPHVASWLPLCAAWLRSLGWPTAARDTTA